MLSNVRTWVQREVDEFPRALDRALEGCDSVLDVGCGARSPLQGLTNRPRRIVGVDGFAPAIEESRRQGIHDEYHEISLLEIGRRFGRRSFDAVVLLDVIEHFEKSDGLALLDLAEAIAARRVIVFTPNGFLHQGEHYGNPLQLHRSGWTAREMRARGYAVAGVSGIRLLRGELTRVRFRPKWFWNWAALLSQPLARWAPELAFQILCTRDAGPG